MSFDFSGNFSQYTFNAGKINLPNPSNNANRTKNKKPENIFNNNLQNQQTHNATGTNNKKSFMECVNDGIRKRSDELRDYVSQNPGCANNAVFTGFIDGVVNYFSQ